MLLRTFRLIPALTILALAACDEQTPARAVVDQIPAPQQEAAAAAGECDQTYYYNFLPGPNGGTVICAAHRSQCDTNSGSGCDRRDEASDPT